MVKRSREDFDTPSTTESEDSPEPLHGARPASIPSDTSVNATESSKFLHIDFDGGEASTPSAVMRCSLPPHARQTISFASFEDYEVHYNKTHVNRCVECGNNFPTPHFLDLHISENHNPLVEVLRDKGERTYACFVEDCDRKCSTPQKRRMHLIDKHMYPKDYDFYVVNDGIDQRNSMLRSGKHRRRSSALQQKNNIEDRARRQTSTLGNIAGEYTVEENLGSPNGEDTQADGSDVGAGVTLGGGQVDTDMDGLAGAMSALKFVPASVRFGRGRGRGGFSRS